MFLFILKCKLSWDLIQMCEPYISPQKPSGDGPTCRRFYMGSEYPTCVGLRISNECLTSHLSEENLFQDGTLLMSTPAWLLTQQAWEGPGKVRAPLSTVKWKRRTNMAGNFGAGGAAGVGGDEPCCGQRLGWMAPEMRWTLSSQTPRT